MCYTIQSKIRRFDCSKSPAIRSIPSLCTGEFLPFTALSSTSVPPHHPPSQIRRRTPSPGPARIFLGPHYYCRRFRRCYRVRAGSLALRKEAFIFPHRPRPPLLSLSYFTSTSQARSSYLRPILVSPYVSIIPFFPAKDRVASFSSHSMYICTSWNLFRFRCFYDTAFNTFANRAIACLFLSVSRSFLPIVELPIDFGTIKVLFPLRVSGESMIEEKEEFMGFIVYIGYKISYNVFWNNALEFWINFFVNTVETSW